MVSARNYCLLHSFLFVITKYLRRRRKVKRQDIMSFSDRDRISTLISSRPAKIPIPAVEFCVAPSLALIRRDFGFIYFEVLTITLRPEILPQWFRTINCFDEDRESLSFTCTLHLVEFQSCEGTFSNTFLHTYPRRLWNIAKSIAARFHPHCMPGLLLCLRCYQYSTWSNNWEFSLPSVFRHVIHLAFSSTNIPASD